MSDNPKTPRQVLKTSKVKYWFKCDVCNKDFKESPYNINYKDKWCPYCALDKKFNNKITLYESQRV